MDCYGSDCQMEFIKIVSFVDDIALTITDRAEKTLMRTGNQALKRIVKWMNPGGKVLGNLKVVTPV